MPAPCPAKALIALAKAQLGPGIGVAAFDLSYPPPDVLEAEAIAIARAVDKRKREFAAGRAAARAALAEIGAAPAPIPPGDDRAPIWPPGIVGSITHSGSIALAAVARDTTARAIGIDLEEAGPVEDSLLDIILTPAERTRLGALPAEDRRHLAKTIFVTKECAYKCQYPLSRELFSFDALEVTMFPAAHPAEGRFEARRVDPHPQAPVDLHRLSGQYGTTAGYTLATMALPR